MVYMLKFMEWAKMKAQPGDIVRWTHKQIKNEKEQKSNLANSYRKAIHNTMREKQEEIGGGMQLKYL